MKEDLLTKYRKLDEIAAGIDAHRMSISEKNRGLSMAIEIKEENEVEGDHVWNAKNRKEAESDSSDETLTFNIDANSEKSSEYTAF